MLITAMLVLQRDGWAVLAGLAHGPCAAGATTTDSRVPPGQFAARAIIVFTVVKRLVSAGSKNYWQLKKPPG